MVIALQSNWSLAPPRAPPEYGLQRARRQSSTTCSSPLGVPRPPAAAPSRPPSAPLALTLPSLFRPPSGRGRAGAAERGEADGAAAATRCHALAHAAASAPGRPLRRNLMPSPRDVAEARKVLGLAADASLPALRSAFVALARATHPDTPSGGDSERCVVYRCTKAPPGLKFYCFNIKPTEIAPNYSFLSCERRDEFNPDSSALPPPIDCCARRPGNKVGQAAQKRHHGGKSSTTPPLRRHGTGLGARRPRTSPPRWRPALRASRSASASSEERLRFTGRTCTLPTACRTRGAFF